MLSMMLTSRGRSFSSQLSFLSLQGGLMLKVGTCCVSYFVSQLNEKEFSLVSTAVELGLASLATYNFQFEILNRVSSVGVPDLFEDS